MPDQHAILAILTVRNEAAFLLEWLAHHRAAGITDFLVYSNDCQDGTDEMLDRLQALGWLQHESNPGPYENGGIQFTALKRAAKQSLTRQAAWILPLDIDEFVNIHVGDQTLPALINALPDATAITLTWRLFGNGGVIDYEDAPVTETFTRAAPDIIHWPWRAAMFKTLYRNDGTYRKPGGHRPRDPDKTRLKKARWFDAHGRELPESLRTKGIFSAYGRPNFALAQLNHYPLGAMESFVLKADRGRAVHTDQRLGADYWVERNYTSDEDRSVLSLAPIRAKLQAELMSDPELARLHARAVQWRRTRFAELMEDEPNRALFARLLMTPPSTPISAVQAARMLKYAVKQR